MNPAQQAAEPLSAPDLAIIGAGIAGGALAVAAARAGRSVLLLERSERHEDRVRGEYIPPWGVQEARTLGVLDVFLGAGAHFVRQSVGYGEDIAPAQAEARAIALDRMVAGVEGALTFGHPQVCSALNEAAAARGAVLLRGVGDIRVTPGRQPAVSFSHGGREHTVRPRLVVGADGRGSRVAKALGLQVHSHETGYLLTGLLVDGAEGWPEDRMTIGTEGNVLFYVFPQGRGRVRLYAGFDAARRGRFSGGDKVQRVLDAFRLASLPRSDALATARPIGPCHGYPSGDTWIDRPGAPGVVLIGDAAGHNCPVLGQGVSIALRDARHVVEAMTQGEWTDVALDAYATERSERMRRLRFAAQLFTELRADFRPEGRARRQRVMQRVAADPTIYRPLFASQLGPHALPAECFTPAARERLLA